MNLLGSRVGFWFAFALGVVSCSPHEFKLFEGQVGQESHRRPAVVRRSARYLTLSRFVPSHCCQRYSRLRSHRPTQITAAKSAHSGSDCR